MAKIEIYGEPNGTPSTFDARIIDPRKITIKATADKEDWAINAALEAQRRHRDARKRRIDNERKD